MLNPAQLGLLDRLFPVLLQLRDQDRRSILESGQIVDVPAGQMLMQQNQQCQFIPLVLSGQLRVFKLSPAGREMTLFRTGPGDTCLLSIACQLKGEEFPALAQVEEDARLFMLPVSVYHAILSPQPVWKDFLIVTLYGHLAAALTTLEAVAFDRTDRRLAGWLVAQMPAQGHTIRCTHEAIAVELGTAREVVSRLLGELKNQGAVSLGRGRIEILRPALLRQISAEPA
jgi:CRP/FNR family transcriptional regulator